MTKPWEPGFWAVWDQGWVWCYLDKPERHEQTGQWFGRYLFTIRDVRWNEAFGHAVGDEPVHLQITMIEVRTWGQ